MAGIGTVGSNSARGTVAPFLFTIDDGHLHAGDHASQARSSSCCVVAGIFYRGKSFLVARGTHADRNVKKDSEGKGTRRRADRKEQSGHENVSFCTPRVFVEIDAVL